MILVIRQKVFITTLILMLTSLWLPHVSASVKATDVLSIDAAVNKAGRQRMLTQRIMKSYLLAGQKVSVGEAQEQLDESIAMFERQLDELEDFAPNKTVKIALKDVRDLWNRFRTEVIKKPNRKMALNLIEKNEILLQACEKVVKQITAYSGTGKSQIIDMSGRQRMLSQRMGMLYLAKSWGIQNKGIDKKFKVAIVEYDKALTKLMKSNLNSGDIIKLLAKVSSHWAFSRSGFDMIDSGRYVPFVIQVTTESMLKRMDKVTHLYVLVSANG